MPFSAWHKKIPSDSRSKIAIMGCEEDNRQWTIDCGQSSITARRDEFSSEQQQSEEKTMRADSSSSNERVSLTTNEMTHAKLHANLQADLPPPKNSAPS
jgi:hypothetical protein